MGEHAFSLSLSDADLARLPLDIRQRLAPQVAATPVAEFAQSFAAQFAAQLSVVVVERAIETGIRAAMAAVRSADATLPAPAQAAVAVVPPAPTRLPVDPRALSVIDGLRPSLILHLEAVLRAGHGASRRQIEEASDLPLDWRSFGRTVSARLRAAYQTPETDYLQWSRGGSLEDQRLFIDRDVMQRLADALSHYLHKPVRLGPIRAALSEDGNEVVPLRERPAVSGADASAVVPPSAQGTDPLRPVAGEAMTVSEEAEPETTDVVPPAAVAGNDECGQAVSQVVQESGTSAVDGSVETTSTEAVPPMDAAITQEASESELLESTLPPAQETVEAAPVEPEAAVAVSPVDTEQPAPAHLKEHAAAARSDAVPVELAGQDREQIPPVAAAADEEVEIVAAVGTDGVAADAGPSADALERGAEQALESSARVDVSTEPTSPASPESATVSIAQAASDAQAQPLAQPAAPPADGRDTCEPTASPATRSEDLSALSPLMSPRAPLQRSSVDEEAEGGKSIDVTALSRIIRPGRQPATRPGKRSVPADAPRKAPPSGASSTTHTVAPAPIPPRTLPPAASAARLATSPVSRPAERRPPTSAPRAASRAQLSDEAYTYLDVRVGNFWEMYTDGHE